MVKTLFIGMALLLAAILLMGMRVFFSKNGKFPNTHIGASMAMKNRGITCAASQAREAYRKESPVLKVLKDK